MKLFIVLFVLLIGCSRGSTSSLDEKISFEESLAESGFSNIDIESINALIKYFEAKIEVDKIGLKKAYTTLFLETSLDYELVNHAFNKDSLNAFFLGLPKTTRNEIWSIVEITAFRSWENKAFVEPKKYKSWDINTNGKYIKLLKLLSKDDPSVQEYLNNIILSGSIPNRSVFESILIDKKGRGKVNFESRIWRMIIAIQFITEIEDTYKYMELSNECNT